MAELFDGMSEQMRWKEDPANLQSAQEKIDANNKRIAELKARLAELKQLKAENDMAARFLDVGDASMFNSIMSSRSSREMQKAANAADAENQRRKAIDEMQDRAEMKVLELKEIEKKIQDGANADDLDALVTAYNYKVAQLERIERDYPEVNVSYSKFAPKAGSGKSLDTFKERFDGLKADGFTNDEKSAFLKELDASGSTEKGFNEFRKMVANTTTKEEGDSAKASRQAKARNAIAEINDFAAADPQAEGALEADKIRREIKEGAKEFTWKGDRYIKTKSGWELAE